MILQSTDIESTLAHVRELLEIPFWEHGDFWISSVIGLGGAFIAFLAYRQAEQAKEEATKAKQAATEAGRTVKLQTMSIELTEVAQKLVAVVPGIRFNSAKDLFNETSRRSRRVMAPFADHAHLHDAIEAVRTALQAAQASLKQVRPADPTKESETPDAVYYGIEDNFATINNCVADLLGLVEKETTDFGEDDDK
jgi:hypothetical protein